MELGRERVYVGPLLHIIYEGMDSRGRATFRDFVLHASPMHELTATFPGMPDEIAQSILAQLKHAPVGPNGVIGASGNASGYIFWATGDTRDVLLEVAAALQSYADEARMDPRIQFRSPTPDQLRELA